jgi:hypothetical protein
VEFTPSFQIVDFPISVGKSWTTTLSNIDGRLEMSLLPSAFLISDLAGGDFAECIDYTSKTVPAGTYDSYIITTNGDIEEEYYAPDAGNIIKAFGAISQNMDFTLKSTNYASGGDPGAPNKPSKPIGPNSGTPGNYYTYTTSTTDFEGDEIFFWFDWGDGTNSDWIGPYLSGEICEASKTWSSRGTFSVKVKAKDDEGNTSPWSDSLAVTMPRARFSESITFNSKIQYLLKFLFTTIFN